MYVLFNFVCLIKYSFNGAGVHAAVPRRVCDLNIFVLNVSDCLIELFSSLKSGCGRSSVDSLCFYVYSATVGKVFLHYNFCKLNCLMNVVFMCLQ